MSTNATLPLSVEQDDITFVPPVPETLEDLGVAKSLVEEMILKILYFRGDTSGRVLANTLGINFSVIAPLVENMKRQQLLMAKSSLGMGDISSTFATTEAARELTREYLESNSYCGRIPVPLEQYTAHTITDFDALEREIETVRRDGHAIDNEEFLPGLFCIAVLVPRPGGRSNTCIAIQAPVMRVSRDKALGFLPALQRAAQAIAAIDAAAIAPDESGA